MKCFLAALLVLFALAVSTAGFAGGTTAPAAPAIGPAISRNVIMDDGDSLTQGGQDGTALTTPIAIQNAMNVAVVNNGIGGQTSTQIAGRMGLGPVTLTLSGASITGAGFNTVTAINNVALAGMATTQNPDYRLLSTPADITTRFLPGTLCGVHGNLKRSATGGPPSTVETYAFIADQLTVTTACAAQSVFTPDNYRLASQPFIFEGGRNNYANATTVQSDWTNVAATAAAAGNPNYLLLTALNGDYPTEYSGQAGYSQIGALNSYLASTYPNNSWDWRSWLVAQYNPANIVDVYNHTNDVVPYTLRAQVGAGTLAAAITTTGQTSISVTATTGAPANNQTLLIDGEYLYVTAVSGSSSPYTLAVTRGYGTGGVAATHLIGAAYTAHDPLHLAGTTYQAVGAYIAANEASLLTPAVRGYVAPAPLGANLTRTPLFLGSPNSGVTVLGQLNFLNNVNNFGVSGTFNAILPNNGWIATVDQNGNPISLLRSSNAVIQEGGANVVSYAWSTGNGTSGANAMLLGNTGGLRLGSAATDYGAGTVSAMKGAFSAAFVSTGAPPANTGTCAITSQTGGESTGFFNLSGACTGGTIVLGLAAAGAPTGFVCRLIDITTPADVFNETATTPTSVTFAGTGLAGDLMGFSCSGG